MFNYRLKIIGNEKEIYFEENELESIVYSFDPSDDSIVKGKNELSINFLVNFISDPNDYLRTKMSKEKLVKLISFLEDKENDFGEVIIEFIFSERDTFSIVFKEMFIDFIKQNINRTNSVGRYEVGLKQKYYSSGGKIEFKGV